MESKVSIYLPPQFVLAGSILGNAVRQLRRPEIQEMAELQPFLKRRTTGSLVRQRDGTTTLIVARSIAPPADVDEVLLNPAGGVPPGKAEASGLGSSLRWLRPKPSPASGARLSDLEQSCERVRASWQGQFSFREEQYAHGKLVEAGLRPPQIGALYAALAHWKVTRDPATIVMPTGTGKTETMLALLVKERLERLLVIVPSTALREQIGEKFLTLGLLKQLDVIGCGALFPVVGLLAHRLRTPQAVDAYFSCCNVVVTTMSVVSGCPDDVQRAMAEQCSHLFIDEAHHISAPTWERFRRYFLEQTAILQFTATPFRSDGKHVDGKVIFNYPLRKAQEEGYFRSIRFLPIDELRPERADEAIARAAMQQLEQDLQDGYDHILMARAADIKRATQIFALYERCAAAYHPRLIHSGMPDVAKRAAILQLRNRTSRVVVCVDMLGEGFDLPELKIAALHDMHKSLAITLQFMGRFTRTKRSIGDATVIANIADAEVEESLRDLYAEDADWNVLLRRLSEGATNRQVRRSEFLAGFLDAPAEIPLQNVFPKMSTVVYRTTGRTWWPEHVRDVVKAGQLYAGPTVNPLHNVLLFVTREYEPIPWGSIKEIRNTVWHLYLLHWDAEHKLLYINSSNNDSLHEELAKAVAGEDVQLMRGEQVFRTLHGINRLMLMNLGLNHSLSRAVRFTMFVGADIRQGLAEAHFQNKIKSNLFGRGFENGDKASVGCSYKGRIWSYKIAYDIGEWVDWCHSVGRKLLDDSISVREILEHVIIPRQITTRPELVPLVIEWSEDLLQRSEDVVEFDIAGEVVPFFEVGLELVEHRRAGPLRFRVFTETSSVEYEVRFRANSVEYLPTGGESVTLVLGRKRIDLSEWLQKEPPVMRFEDGVFLIYNELSEVPRDARRSFEPGRIETWDWSGVDLKKESQTVAKLTDSIQHRLIQALLHADHDPNYDVVFDDDAAYEAADVVALKVAGERLLVHFFHCKYAASAHPGARVDDLYAVCGQAQRSVYWKGDVRGLLDHLRYREGGRLRKHNVSRFERGDVQKIGDLIRRLPFLTPEFKIFIVQPGLSKTKVESSQLELLAVTELYLQETYAIEVGVIASP